MTTIGFVGDGRRGIENEFCEVERGGKEEVIRVRVQVARR
jgi:hypothetical protein